MSGLAAIPILLATASLIYLTLRGVLPVWHRLGLGLSRRKIAVFAEQEFDGLRDLLADSGIFRRSNVVQIDQGSLKKSRGPVGVFGSLEEFCIGY